MAEIGNINCYTHLAIGICIILPLLTHVVTYTATTFQNNVTDSHFGATFSIHHCYTTDTALGLLYQHQFFSSRSLVMCIICSINNIVHLRVITFQITIPSSASAQLAKSTKSQIKYHQSQLKRLFCVLITLATGSSSHRQTTTKLLPKKMSKNSNQHSNMKKLILVMFSVPN